MSDRGNDNYRNKGSNDSSSSPPEPFAEDVRRLRELRAAERADAASAPPHRRLAALARRLWLQYLITWAAYCFDWWERLVVHLCLLTVAGLLFYGLRLGARAARAVAAAASAASQSGAVAAALGRGSSSRGGGGGRGFGGGFASFFWR